MNEKALKRIEEEKKKRTGKLDLSNLALMAIPEELGKMDWLTHFDASWNQIMDFSPIQELENLTHIDLGNNQISDISPIQGLNRLTEINFESNQISDIFPVQNLKQLKIINFSTNKILNIPAFLDLNNLIILDFGRNEIIDLSPIQSLKNLKIISFWDNRISDISPIQGLNQLKEIYFSFNNIIDLSPVENLTDLTQLSFVGNKISDISPINKLTKLTEIDFGENKINSLSSIKELKNLTKIKFNDNKIVDITAIRKLKNLVNINFDRNNIHNISPLYKLRLLKNLSLINNKIYDINQFDFIKNLPNLFITVNDNPFENSNSLFLFGLENQYEEILLALQKLQETKEFDAVDGFLPVKILLLGNHGSGKSSLVQYLKYDNLNYKGDTTHILKIEAYIKQDNGLPKAYFYDFGGQDFYHGLYQAFLRQGLMTVMLWNEASNQNIKSEDSKGKAIRHYNVPYWLGQWKRSIDGKLVLVQSHKDVENCKRISHNGGRYSIDDEFYVSLKKHVSKLDPKSHHAATLKYLKITIDDYISKEQSKQAGEGKISKKYYDFITYIQSEGGKIKSNSMKLLELKPHYKDVDDERFDTEIEQLVLSGIILKYQDTVWLNPAAVVEKVHEVLSKELIDKESVSETDIENIVKDQDLIGLLKKQKVIFWHQHGQKGPEYIIPNYLTLIESSGIDYDLMVFGLDNPLFILKYEDFMPFGLINQLICHFGQLPDRKKFWRDQLLFTISKKDGEKTIHQAKILIKLNFNDLKLEVYAHFDKTCDNDGFKDLVKEYIFYSILSFEKNWKFPAFEEFKKINERNSPSHDFNHDHIIYLFASKFDVVISHFNNSFTFEDFFRCYANIYISLNNLSYINFTDLLKNRSDVNIKTFDENLHFYREMPAYPYKAFTPYKIEKMKKVFISYSRKDVDFKNELRNHLNLVKTLNIFDNWSCEDINFGKWDDQIQYELESSDLIVYMLSANFFSSRYILEKEVLKGMKLIEENPSKQFYCVVVRDFIGLDKLKDSNKAPNELENAILNLSNYQYGVYDYVKNPLSGQNEEKIVSLANWANQGKLDTAMTKIVEKIVEFLK